MARRAEGAGLRLVLGECQSTASAWTTTASRAIVQYRQAVTVDAPLSADTAGSVTGRARGSITPENPGMSLKDNRLQNVAKMRHCARGRSDASPADHSGMASLGPALLRLNAACACPALLHATPQVRVSAGRRPSRAWARSTGGASGHRCGWYRARESSPASRFWYHAQRPLSTPSNGRRRRAGRLQVAP